MAEIRHLEVGKPYIAGRTSWPEGVAYDFRGDAHELRMFLRSPSVSEVRAVRGEVADFAVVAEPPLLFLLYCFGRVIPWSDAPYSWHLVPEYQRSLPDVGGPETRALLQIILVDATTGLVRALRAVTFSPAFTRALHDAIRAQASAPWPGQAGYETALAAVYQRDKTSADLLKRAIAQTFGGA